MAGLYWRNITGKLARWNVNLYPITFGYQLASQLYNADGLFWMNTEIKAEASASAPAQIPLAFQDRCIAQLSSALGLKRTQLS